MKQSYYLPQIQETLRTQERVGFEQQSDKYARQERGEITKADIEEALGRNARF